MRPPVTDDEFPSFLFTLLSKCEVKLVTKVPKGFRACVTPFRRKIVEDEMFFIIATTFDNIKTKGEKNMKTSLVN